MVLSFYSFSWAEHYEVIVIPIDKKVAANTDADKVDKGKTSKTFTVELSANGKLPATHNWCCWWVSDKEATDLKKDFTGTADTPGAKHESRMFDRRIWTPEKILEKMGLKTIELDLGKEPKVAKGR